MSASLLSLRDHTHSHDSIDAGGGTLPEASIPTIPLSTLSSLTAYIAAHRATHFATGMIMLWPGATAPEGWVVCDGTNGTPDLRSRFAKYTSTASGGGAAISVTSAHIPHTHTASSSSSHSHGHANVSSSLTNHSVGTSGSHNHGGTTAAGGAHAHACPVDHGNSGTSIWRCGYAGWNDTPFDFGRRTSDVGNHTHGLPVATGSHSHTVDISHSHATDSVSHSHTISLSAPSGSASSVNLGVPRPQYHALTFIMKT